MTDIKAVNTAAESLPELLNIGCGDDYRDGWHNVDIDEAVDADEYRDLAETPWPWPDDHFVRIEARHVLEHLPAVPWEELARVLAPDGRLVWAYPIGHTRFEDATHEQFWTYNTAAQVAGERAHTHEVNVPLELADVTVDWDIGHAEPLVRLYTRYRLAVSGPGPWLGQIPGLYGQVLAVYTRGERPR